MRDLKLLILKSVQIIVLKTKIESGNTQLKRYITIVTLCAQD